MDIDDAASSHVSLQLSDNYSSNNNYASNVSHKHKRNISTLHLDDSVIDQDNKRLEALAKITEMIDEVADSPTTIKKPEVDEEATAATTHEVPSEDTTTPI